MAIRRLTSLLAATVAIVVVLVASSSPASAHPRGNFTALGLSPDRRLSVGLAAALTIVGLALVFETWPSGACPIAPCGCSRSPARWR